MHEKRTKPGEMKAEDILDVLDGDATLDFGDDVQLPPDLGFDNRPSASLTQASNQHMWYCMLCSVCR